MSGEDSLSRIRRLIADATTPVSGPTTNRPVVKVVGYQYFDTTLGKPIWLKVPHETTPVWVDATGATV